MERRWEEKESKESKRAKLIFPFEEDCSRKSMESSDQPKKA